MLCYLIFRDLIKNYNMLKYFPILLIIDLISFLEIIISIKFSSLKYEAVQKAIKLIILT
jgi:hypothetical protein